MLGMKNIMKSFISYEGNFPLGADHQSIYFMSTIFLIYKINVVCVTKFQLAYVCNKTHPSYIKMC